MDIKTIKREIKEEEQELKDIGVKYIEVLENTHTLIDEDCQNANFSAGRLHILYRLEKGV